MAALRSRRRGVVRKLLDRLVGVFVFVLILWGAGLIWFAETIPGRVLDEDTRTEAIAVLTGGSGRLDEGLGLLARGLAGKLYISGVYKGVDIQTLLTVLQQKPGSLDCCLVIGYAEDTIGNARETTVWMRQEGYRSLRVVTSAYHMPRALLEFRFAYPGIRIVPHPVLSEHVKQEQWWAWPGTASLMMREYNKYLAAWIRQGAVRLLKTAQTG